MSAAPPDVRDLPEPPLPDDAPQPQERITASTRLVHLAEARYEFGVTEDGEPFAHPREGALRHVGLPLRGGRLGLRAALAADYFDAEGRAASQSALADALSVLEGKAKRLAPTELHLRTAEAEGSIWLDVGDDQGHVIELRAGAWRVSTDAPPVMFQRTELTVPMPLPVRGGDVHDLFELINVAPEDRPVLLAVLAAAWMPTIPHPIPTFSGEQGTGKSTAATMLTELLDPAAVPLRKPPRDGDQFVTAASGSWVVGIDNISAIPDWLSDALCRGVTGDGDVRRQLYQDRGLTVFKYRRQFVLTGIDFAGLRGDLAERLVQVELHRIGDRARRTEHDLRDTWERSRPMILGSLLDLACKVLEALPTIQVAELPRMADFARALAAVDQIHGTHGLARYRSQSAEIAADTLSAFAAHIMGRGLDFLGTASDLLDARPLDPEQRAPRGWPTSARAVTSDLKRNAPALRKNGWTVEQAGEDRNHTKLWHIRHPDWPCAHE